MSKVDDKKINALIHSIGLKYGLQDEVIKKIVNSPYRFTREVITHLDFDNIETEEQFNELKTNFIYRYLFKLYTNYDKLERNRKQKETLSNYNREVKWKNE